jgi:hypothetical protein
MTIKGPADIYLSPTEITEITEILLRMAVSEGDISFISFISVGQ